MKQLSRLTLLVLCIALLGSQANAFEIGASFWLPEGTFTPSDNDAQHRFSGNLKVLTAPGSPIGIGPVALVSETSLGTDQKISGIKAMIQDKTGEGFFFADFLAGVRMNLPIKLMGISAHGIVSYGATGYSDISFKDEQSQYLTSIYWGPRFRAQLKADLAGSLLTAIASYEYAPELQGLRKRGSVEGQASENISGATLTNYRVGLEGNIPFATIGAGYRVSQLEDNGYNADFSGYYAEARFGF